MKYYKKSCILRQLKQGFSGDGKPLSGLIKVEKYGQNLAVEISIINFAPLTKGEYYCLLCDGFGKVEKLPLRGKCYFNLLSDFNPEKGFCGIICFIYEEVIPIACGIGGEERYDFPTILAAAFPAKKTAKKAVPDPIKEENEPPVAEFTPVLPDSLLPEKVTESAIGNAYDDEEIAGENYYEKEKNHERNVPEKSSEDVSTNSGSKDEIAQAGASAPKDENDEDVCQPFKVDGKGYYDAVQDEIRALFDAHPRDDTLKGAFTASEWVRIKGEASNPQYLVGVVYEELLPKYICYAIAANGSPTPPEEFGDACVFVPSSEFEEQTGFFVIFQSAATGECIRPKQC